MANQIDKYLSFLEVAFVTPTKSVAHGWGYEAVPNLDDYDEYSTFKDYFLPEDSIIEQDKEEEEVPEEAPPEEAPPEEAPEEEMPAGEEGMPPEEGGMGGEAGMAGVEEEPKTVEEIGRVYELKKIYSRLVAIESYLADSSEITLLKLRNFVSNSIELFETLISNIDTYKGDLDDTIVIYYEFIDRTYWILNKYYQQKEEEEKRDNKR